MLNLVMSPLERNDEIEIVERKGIGHPDSICDALAETLSRNLCREYRRWFGEILHHNVDKALLCGGQAAPIFGGGTVVAPIQVYLAGRATAKIGNEILPIDEIAVEGSRAWLKHNLHALDTERHVRIRALVQQGSEDLTGLFARRGSSDAPLANDTSFGVGYAPLTALERLTLAVDARLNAGIRDRPAWGEDTTIMAVRRADAVRITVACAMIGRFILKLDDYLEQKAELTSIVHGLAGEHGFSNCGVSVNAADDRASGSIYLTVTGTSAEAGDDGQVGRGNRVNGLITPCRSMSLEAAAGKNPVSHVGKLYNVLARDIAERIVAQCPDVVSAECLMVRKIGARVAEPALVQVKLATENRMPVEAVRTPVEEIIAGRLLDLPGLLNRLVAGEIRLF